MLVTPAHFKLLLKLPVLCFELCGFGSDYGQVSFVELACAVAVLLQNFRGGLKRSGILLKLLLLFFKCLRRFFGVGFSLLLPRFFGLDGVLYSMPVSDLLTFLFSAVVLARTYRSLRRTPGPSAVPHENFI